MTHIVISDRRLLLQHCLLTGGPLNYFDSTFLISSFARFSSLHFMAEEEPPKSPPPSKPETPQQDNDDEEDDEDTEEDEEPLPKLPRISSNDAVTISSPSPLVLGLSLGGAASSSSENSSSTFTFMQRQELHHHLRIFDYIVRRAPVPLDLVLPIWKSVAASYGPHHYPSFVGLGNLCYDFRNSMEPEPGRCRRTDGKKWRCSRDVIPDQKYCERHMHRGRVRSRKPVEGPPSTDDVSATISPDSVLAARGAGGGGTCKNPVPVEE